MRGMHVGSGHCSVYVCVQFLQSSYNQKVQKLELRPIMSDTNAYIMQSINFPDSTTVNGQGNHGDQVRNYLDQRGSAARFRSLVPVGADPGGSPGQGRQRGPKRGFGEAMSRRHAATALSQALTDAPSRMNALVLKGLHKEVRDKIQQADDQLTLTRAMRV